MLMLIDDSFFEKYELCDTYDTITIFGTIWGHLEVDYEINTRADQNRSVIITKRRVFNL